MKKLFLTAIILAVAVSFFSTPVFAYVMQSASYRLQFDSINNGGGLGTSTSYIEQDTVGEIATGFSTSTSFNLFAGYQQMDSVSTTISLSVPNSVSMLPNIPGVSGGTATGSADIVVSTNNNAGYSADVVASTFPALTSGGNIFSDYSESVSMTPDFNWSILSTGSAFGFSVEGDNVSSEFLDNGSACNTGSGNVSDKCWSPFSTSPNIFGYSPSASLGGSTTTLNLRAESGTQHIQPSGNYTANLTITAYVN